MPAILTKLLWRRWLLVATGLAVSMHAGWWFIGCWTLHSRVQQQLAAWQSAGMTWKASDWHRTGYPWRIGVAWDNPQIRYRNHMALNAQGMRVFANWWAGPGLAIELGGLQWRADSVANMPVTLAAEAQAARIQLTPAIDQQPTRIDVDLTWLQTAGATAKDIHASVDLAESAPIQQITLLVQNIKLPPPLDQQPPIARFGLRVQQQGPLADYSTAAIDQWRQAGGTIELTQLYLEWNDAAINGNATLALDRHLQPLLAGTVELHGIESLANAFVAAGLFAPNKVRLAQMTLAMMAERDPQGRSRLQAPISIQDGRLTSGRFTLAAVPAIQWP